MADSLKNPPKRGLSENELRERQDDLEKALDLFKSVVGCLTEATPILESALMNADRLRQMCERNPVLRAAMVSRRLSVNNLIQDVKGIKFKASIVSKFVGKTLQSRRDELQEAILNPELLR